MRQEQKFIANGNGTDSMAKTLFDRALPKFEGPVKLDLRLKIFLLCVKPLPFPDNSLLWRVSQS